MEAGFDVNGDLIAAATADRRVQLFNVRSGREVQMGSGSSGMGTLECQARCIKFVEDEGQQTKLFVAAGSVVEEWSWNFD